MQNVNDNIFKEPMGVKEASSIVGSESRKHGKKLEDWVRHDINGVINGFGSYHAYNMNKDDCPGLKHALYGNQPVQSDILITNGLGSDTKPALIVESRGSVNENIKELLFMSDVFKESGIPFAVVTKDTKRVFRTGNSKYLDWMKENGNVVVFINNHNNYDDSKMIFQWDEYCWNDMVRPYHEFNTYLFETINKDIEKNKTNKINQFFDFTYNTK